MNYAILTQIIKRSDKITFDMRNQLKAHYIFINIQHIPTDYLGTYCILLKCRTQARINGGGQGDHGPRAEIVGVYLGVSDLSITFFVITYRRLYIA
jgi:hypothetical protein